MEQSVHPVVRKHPWDTVQARLVPTRQGAPSGPECRPRRAQGSRVVASPLGAWPERSRQHWPIEELRPATSKPAVSRPGLLLQGPALEPRGDFPLAPLESWGCPGLKPSWLLCNGGVLLIPCSGSRRLPCCSRGPAFLHATVEGSLCREEHSQVAAVLCSVQTPCRPWPSGRGLHGCAVQAGVLIQAGL